MLSNLTCRDNNKIQTALALYGIYMYIYQSGRVYSRTKLQKNLGGSICLTVLTRKSYLPFSKTQEFTWLIDKALYVTSRKAVFGSGWTTSHCNHEEVETRIVVHIQHVLEQGTMTVQVCTVDPGIGKKCPCHSAPKGEGEPNFPGITLATTSLAGLHYLTWEHFCGLVCCWDVLQISFEMGWFKKYTECWILKCGSSQAITSSPNLYKKNICLLKSEISDKTPRC